MRIGKLKKLLNLWQKNNLISEEQNNNISEFMKERQKANFFRLLKWLSIIGALWLFFGIIATIINLLELDFFKPLLEFLTNCFKSVSIFLMTYIINPVHDFIYSILKEGTGYFFGGIASFIFFFIFNHFANKKLNSSDIDNLNLSDEQKYSLKNNFVMDIFASLCLASTFINFNIAFMGENIEKNFPLVYLLGAITFVIMAYRYSKNIYLLFGILFVAATIGMGTFYCHATYGLSVSAPVIQILVGFLILAAGYIRDLKLQLSRKDNFIQEKFMGTYDWTGLLFLFLALWFATFFGFGSEYNAKTGELWIANILLILTSIGTMYFGVKCEKKVFFNYGLVFLLIETYTVFCPYLWELLPAGFASILFGGMLIGTVKILKKVYLIKSKEIKN